MRVVEFQLSGNFLAYSQPSVNLNSVNIMDKIHTFFFYIFDNCQRLLRNHFLPAARECTTTSTMF